MPSAVGLWARDYCSFGTRSRSPPKAGPWRLCRDGKAHAWSHGTI